MKKRIKLLRRRISEGRKEGKGSRGGSDGGEGKKGSKENNKSKKMIEIVIWNIARLKEKTEIFLDYLERFDIIGMCKKWIEKRD